MAHADWLHLDPRLWPAAEHGRMPRRFGLFRESDRTGVSGTGLVALGVIFPGGKCIISWLPGPHHSVGVYDSLAAVEAIHGHSGATEVLWFDKE